MQSKPDEDVSKHVCCRVPTASAKKHSHPEVDVVEKTPAGGLGLL